MLLSAFVLGGALALDALVGEPPQRLHPVAWFGALVARVDDEWTHPRFVGALAALCLPGLAGATLAGVVIAAGTVDPLVGAAAGALVVFVSTSLRRLLERVGDVTRQTEENLDAARDQLRALAGRDAATLSAGEVRSAAVESLAENLADGLVAPLAAYALVAGSLTAVGVSSVVAIGGGCGAGAWVKAVNTLDSMLGYREKPVGWVPARLDDVVMWLPARLSALLIAIVARAPLALLRAHRWTVTVDSPNSGWPMGTLAAALDVRLEKSGQYTLNPSARLPDVDTAIWAVRLVAVTGLLAYALAGVATWI